MTPHATASVHDTAVRYRNAGLSVVPIKPGGDKAPAVIWKPYQERKATDAELQDWFGDGPRGVAIVGGKVSGGLEVIDFDLDAEALLPRFRDRVEAEAPGLFHR